jgi:ATP-dependent Clp protease ATP-binding subunit ClpX
MGNNDNFGGGPPEDNVKKVKERTSSHLKWHCTFCEAEKSKHNRIYVVENVNICSNCIEKHFDFLQENELQVAYWRINCIFCSKKNTDQDSIYWVKNKKQEYVGICSSCIANNKEQLERGNLLQADRALNRIASPGENFAVLNDYVMGQNEAKKAAAVQIYLQELLFFLNDSRREGEDKIERNNLLFVGPTGCGKTLIAEIIRDKLKRPVVIADANSFSEAGYVGEDVSSIFTALLVKAGGDLEKAQRGIVFVDEIDKLAAKPGDGGDVSRKAVQQALLAAIQGTELPIKKGFDLRSAQEKILFDTSELLFIGSGSFAGMEGIIKRRIIEKGMGFGGNITSKTEMAQRNFIKEVNRDDILAFGFIPEFLGRFHRIISFEDLSVAEYLKIMKEPKDSLIWQWTRIFAALDKKLIFDDAALELIAEEARSTKSGARALRGIFVDLFEDLVFEAENDGPEVIGYHLTVDSYKRRGFEKIKKKCSGECGPDCCQITGEECCGGDGHIHEMPLKKAGSM